MASSISKAFCVTCGKGIGQFKCEGCSQIFCTRHVAEHRQTLNQQLDEVILQHHTFQQTIVQNEDQSHPLMVYIDQWEQKSIERIRQTANNNRQKVAQLANTQKQIVSQVLQPLTERIKKAREDDDFFETDLRDWILVLEKLKQTLKTTSLPSDITEDRTTPLIYQIRINSSTPNNLTSPDINDKNRSNHYQMESNEMFDVDRFKHCYGNAKIENNGRSVTNGNESFFGTEIRGQVEYSSGKYRLYFQIDNNPSKIWIFIGIISKTTRMGGNLFTPSSVYGWGDYKDYFLAGQRQKNSADLYFVYTLENDIIELTLDCTNRTILYTNKRCQKSQELSIDTNKCPFPWQLYVSLGGRGDQISLVNTTTPL